MITYHYSTLQVCSREVLALVEKTATSCMCIEIPDMHSDIWTTVIIRQAGRNLNAAGEVELKTGLVDTVIGAGTMRDHGNENTPDQGTGTVKGLTGDIPGPGTTESHQREMGSGPDRGQTEARTERITEGVTGMKGGTVVVGCTDGIVHGKEVLKGREKTMEMATKKHKNMIGRVHCGIQAP